ncbi:YdcH family protein [Aurantiacibacter hainanensis]|uniref:YdcH family protein n=1 Tax=Aurantiacibacter hainanensis TaxID=3076114 RepID=UPI0030C7017E
MSQHTPNELTAIFKRDADLLTRLKTQDAHYARLAEEYHDVNRAVHRHESEAEVVSDDHAEELKKRRLALLDEITAIVEKARAAAA